MCAESAADEWRRQRQATASPAMSRILVVEDEPTIADAVEYALSTEGMTVVRAGTLHAARQHLLS